MSKFTEDIKSGCAFMIGRTIYKTIAGIVTLIIVIILASQCGAN